ncbi:molybdopterin-guanine dinucleotide biosynthesis protein B [Telmatospirillum siberiense]|uniref:Molybdopterin-guanine dinucleotide biosynthesis protein B n=1 Tax=Telmatospirillum siberiense TaxID=382514 RepID=A0A2N3PLT9_9PROT|nr:molybdopterin-guanine dinucleotide biosynthesis protein B [Telmatospirillum siberiense]PKU21362.1 molybdopterin-guanine dinucleotide biosynthesis protein B [Telmatospirillum siberiense]
MRVFGLAGWSGAGKTTLMIELVRRIVLRGIRVSTIKHAHHAFDIDRPGKDSHRHREAGATEVMVTSGARWALMHEIRGEGEPSLDALLAHMTPVDLLLIEGFKSEDYDKLEVHRPELGKPMLWPDTSRIVAVASDVPLGDLPLPRFDLADPDAIVRFILERTGLSR